MAIVSESFLPQVNGVTNSVLRVCEHLHTRGDDVLVLAPASSVRAGGPGPGRWAGARVLRTPSVPLPRYPDFQMGRPWAGLQATLAGFRPDVVHLASPAVLGAQAGRVARRLGVPVVAVYQTDLAGFLARNDLPGAQRAAWRWLRAVHAAAGRTLAPSRAAVQDLLDHGVKRVRRWPRGVDAVRFDPRHRDEAWRREVGGGLPLVGYVGRLAAEKQVELLEPLADRTDAHVVVVGDGPRRAALERLLPRASFLGFLDGAALGRVVASLDVFVHTGAHETFCQAAHEGLASGVPLVAPAAGGLLDLVRPGENGALFSPGDARSLVSAVEPLLTDPTQRARLGAGARAGVASHGWEAVGDQLRGHYLDLAGRSPLPVRGVPRRERAA